jgi:hypothetical protein
MKDRTKRFYNNVNSEKLKSVEDSERSSADLRSRMDRKEGNTNLTVPLKSAEELIDRAGLDCGVIIIHLS